MHFRIDPMQSYVVQRLTGGLVNITARATRLSKSDIPVSRFASHSSFILKHAPPYVAGIGPEAPFSTFRQTIEARALSLFLPSSNSLHHLCEETEVRIPVLLHHDQEEHVLIISDLGPLPNLSEFFDDLASITTAKGVNKDSSARTSSGVTPISPAEGVMIGQKLGSFFAGLHQRTNVEMIRNEPYHDPHFLKHDGMLDMVLEAAIRPVKEQLNLFPDLFPHDAVSMVYQRVEDNFTRTSDDDEKVLALGDCWTGALLIGLGHPTGPPEVAVIDWEFACVGRGVNGDIAQLLAHLCLFEIAAAWQGRADSGATIKAIMEGLIREYRSRSDALTQIWLAKSKLVAPEPHSLTARLLRSAFLAHGAEIVNNAFWKDWVCFSELCCVRGPKEKHQCKLIQTMVRRGWWYLYHAREDEAGFVDKQNWDAIRDECVLMWIFCGRLSDEDPGKHGSQQLLESATGA
ncbi:hypothetical protein GJ744_008262 [Endocarpon pusillum]|uniref:Aminoglycoside phosphotransferase domain-containing protein n=1 Tax=Endocarpon pusillum TaxID=364733 RepID=A0A8H7E4M0_9EURO|nr:hypothetical protein GJ744_008262 [Endocarpon pusillum]